MASTKMLYRSGEVISVYDLEGSLETIGERVADFTQRFYQQYPDAVGVVLEHVPSYSDWDFDHFHLQGRSPETETERKERLACNKADREEQKAYELKELERLQKKYDK